MFKNICKFKFFYFLTIISFSLAQNIFACDTTPTLSPTNVIDNGDGTYYMDISACIGSGGSADGFDLYFNNDINILGTTVTEVTSSTGNVATVNVSNGMWVAYFEEFNTNGTYFENGAWGLDCIDFGIIVDENPEGATICSVGINEDCLGFTQENEFITCEVIPGPCLPNYSITDNGTIDSSVLPAGQNCNFAPFNDEIVELTVTCDGNFNFSLTQDASMNWPGESWLTISAACCSGVIEQTSSFGFLDPTLTIDTYLTEGIYYIVVDIEGNGFPGDYILDITSDADLSLVSIASAGDDQLTCEESITLNANTPLNNESGVWTVVSGGGFFNDPFDPNTTVTGLPDGNNIFQWEISNECAISVDQINIEVANDIILDIPQTVYCLDQIPLIVSAGEGINGEWSVTPEFNVTIDNVTSNNTFATVDAYGNYEFTYTICDDAVSQSVNVESITPELSSPSQEYFCLENFSLSANIIGDPGYWESDGPFIATFDNPVSLNPNIIVDGYGTYTFTYYGCGTSNSITIDMLGIEPSAVGPTNDIFCLDSFEISAETDGDPGFWNYQGPGNAIFDNQGSTNTSVTVDEYGTYLFTYYGCGESSNDVVVTMNTSQPSVSGPEETYCLQNFNLAAETDGDPGYWIYDGPGDAVFSNPNSINTSVSVSEYGMYSFAFNACGTTSEYIYVNSLTIIPQIIQPEEDLTLYCELSTSLEAYVTDDPGYWTFEGPGNAIFSNPDSENTIVEVSEYGTYHFTYQGCGSSSESVAIEFNNPAPIIITDLEDQSLNCEFTTSLIGIVESDNNANVEWFISDGPNQANTSFSEPNQLNTELTVSEYGTYEIGLTACGNTTYSTIYVNPLAPHIIAPDFQNCTLTATLIAYTDDSDGGGPWITTPQNTDVVFSNPESNVTEVTVPDFGLYSFSYPGCDTVSSIIIGFECPLVFANVLTPNGDGNNDLFIVQNLNPDIYTESLFTVFNRWGKIVYTATQYGLNGEWWDGKTTFSNEKVSDGTYYYILEVFNSVNQNRSEHSGEISIFMSNSSSLNDE